MRSGRRRRKKKKKKGNAIALLAWSRREVADLAEGDTQS